MSQQTTPPDSPTPAGTASGDANGADRIYLDRGLLVFLTKSMDLSRPLALALLLSLLVQVGFITYLVLEVPPPPRPTAQSIMDNATIMTLLMEEPEELPPTPEDAVEEEDALVTAEPEPEPEPEEEEDELEMPEEEPPPEELEPEVANLDELEEPPPPEALAYEGIGGSDGGVALPQGNRTLAEAADIQRRSGGRRQSGESQGDDEAEEDDREEEERRRPREPVRLEDAGTPPELRRMDPEIGYPREFREQALAGRVVVQCIITERGSVRACRHRSGPDELGEYVISIVRRWRYEPARDHEGQAIAVFYTFRVPFRLL